MMCLLWLSSFGTLGWLLAAFLVGFLHVIFQLAFVGNWRSHGSFPSFDEPLLSAIYGLVVMLSL